MMWEYVDNAILHAYVAAFLIYAVVNIYKGWDAFKFYASLAIATLFFEALK